MQLAKPFTSKIFKNLQIKNRILFFSDGNYIPVVPFIILTDLVLMIHYNFAHIGRDKILQLFKNLVWHPSKYGVVSELCSTCPICQINKISSIIIKPQMLKICSTQPFELVALDLIYLPKTSSGYIGCLLFVVHYSKWVAAVPIRNKTGLTIAKAFKN